ncbi:alanine/ornithine racemase family PLP-dependent enzyme [Salipaludibacillus sp. HK11]|uniref:alanine/ornithine racemase family PLP-dependent enzyme n=1 Tax=Salipaludibacillus sp. HK11 TaxID=3394320 RepID=UPI0039FD068A
MINSITPRIEINLAKISHNIEKLIILYHSKGIEMTGVVKGVCGQIEIAKVYVEMGIKSIGDSKISSIQKMREANIEAEFILLRIPGLSEIDAVIMHADISLNTELEVIKSLNDSAKTQNKIHKIILMIEMGDLREGILPDDIDDIVKDVLALSNIKIVGIGSNFACFGGVKPTEDKMNHLTSIAQKIQKINPTISLTRISGGNSANYNWFVNTENTGEVNNLRVGESILLGRETLSRMPIPGLYTDAFTFVAEVIESKIKPSVPYGEIAQNTLGITPEFKDRGIMRRAILGVGFQDVLISGLTPLLDVVILGSSSDHTVVDAKGTNLRVGDEIAFSVDYGAMLSIMTSCNISKKYINVI